MHFLQFVRFYKMLNELPLANRPSERVLEDDAELDMWYTNYLRQVANESGQPMSGGGRPQPSKMYEG